MAVTLILRGWSIVAGGVLVWIIPSTLSPVEQGYYFTFTSLLALQIFFELGLNQVLTQITSKEMASSEGLLATSALTRVNSIIEVLKQRFPIAALSFFLLTQTVGFFLFSDGGTLPLWEWLGPWVCLTAFCSVNLYFSPFLAITEGCGHVGQVARLRLWQSVIGSLLTWTCLIAGWGLWAIVVNTTVAGITTWFWLKNENHVLKIFAKSESLNKSNSVDWKVEIFPFQWRIAVSWISGFLMYQLFTPLAFMHLGATTAGKLGLTITIFTSIQTVGVSWFNARIPKFSTFIENRDWQKLNDLFGATFKAAVTITALGALSVVVGVEVLESLGSRLVERLVDISTMLIIALSMVLNTGIYGLAAYMRSHGKEPMLGVSVSAAVITIFAAYFASMFGAFETMLAQALITFMIVAPWTLCLFNDFYKKNQRIV